jgi:hypothetical protein
MESLKTNIEYDVRKAKYNPNTKKKRSFINILEKRLNDEKCSKRITYHVNQIF